MSTEYEALNYDGTERRANYRFVSYRIDILHILGKKEAAAIIFEILYRWETDYHCKRLLKEIEARKKAGIPPLTEEEVADQMWTYMSYNDFVRESGSALGYNTVIRMLTYLIEEKVIEQRENHDPRYADYEYRINKEVVRELLKDLPISPVFAAKVPKKKKGSTQMGTPSDTSTQMGTPAQDSTQMGTGYTQPGTEVYPNGCTSQKDTENSQNEGKNGTPTSAKSGDSLSSTPSLTSLSQVEHLSTIDVDNTQLPIATVTTRNASNTLNERRDTEPLSPPSLSSEGQRIDGYLKTLRFPYPRTQENFDYLAVVAEYIESFEQMNSYYDFTRGLFSGAIFCANLANLNNMSRWVQEQAPLPEKPKQGRPKSLAELNAEKMRYAGITGK